jgi:hypothetical protein
MRTFRVSREDASVTAIIVIALLLDLAAALVLLVK